MEFPELPLRLSLDPDHHLFRRLYPEEIIPCLNAFLESEELLLPPPTPSPRPGEGRKGGKVGGKIFVFSDDEGEESRSGFDSFPMFSPDGKRLVFVSNRNVKRPGEFDIFLADWIP